MRKLLFDYLPPAHRALPQVVDLIDALLAPLDELNAELDTFVDKEVILARANGQFIVIREALEQLTGISGITINQADAPTTSLFLESEATPVYFDTVAEGGSTPVYYVTSSEGFTVQSTYTIGVPSASFSAEVEEEIRQYLLRFALPFTNYNVNAI